MLGAYQRAGHLAHEPGIDTLEPVSTLLVEPAWGAQRVSNLYASYQIQLGEILQRLGLDSIRALRGRTDLLRYQRPEAATRGQP